MLQVVSLTQAKSVLMNMREFLSWAQRHYRIDVTTSTVERKSGGMASAGTCPGGCEEFSLRGSNAHFARFTCKICRTARKEARHSAATRPSHIFPSTHVPQERATHTRQRRLVLIVELALIPFRVRSSTLSRQHVRLLRIAIRSWRIVR